MPGTSFKRPVRDHLRQITGQVDQGLGRRVVRPDAERVFAPQFEERPHLVDDLGDLGGFHRGHLGSLGSIMPRNDPE